MVLATPVAATDPVDTGAPLRVGRITLEIMDIYSSTEVATARGLEKFVRRTMNGLHVETREAVLRRELLFAEGDIYDPEALVETERNLRRLGILNGVVVSAADTTADGTVDVVVRTRDSWSLSTSLAFAMASDGKARWNVNFAETNFLGSAITVGSGLGQDEDRTYWKLWYRKRRLFRTALWLGVDFSEHGDGHYYGLTLAQPFHALDDPWGFHVQAWDHETDGRIYLSHAGPAGVDPAEAASLYGRVPRQQSGVLLSVLRRLSAPGRGRVWRAGIGLRYLDTSYDPGAVEELSDDRWVDLRWLDDGDEPLARDAGREVHPHLALSTEGRSWTERRFVMQYGPVEDIPLHVEGSLTVGPSGGAFGSTTNFGRSAWRGEADVSWWRPAGGGLLLLNLNGRGTTGDRAVRRHAATALAGWVRAVGEADAPWLTRVFVEGAHGSRLNGASAFVLGLDRGLRTLDFDGMAGDRLVRWNVEQGKVTRREYFGLVRAGVAAFYSGGCAWWDDEDRDLSDARHEIGGGLRLGPTRSGNALTTRLDVSWALDGSRGPVFTAVSRGHF
ncbi:MAG: hypothetical protein GY838_15945 [bacterium]|nr:hypothetical protein [bacterium]